MGCLYKGALMNNNCSVKCFELGELASESVALGVWQHKKAKVKTRTVKVDMETKTVKMENGKSENEKTNAELASESVVLGVCNLGPSKREVCHILNSARQGATTPDQI